MIGQVADEVTVMRAGQVVEQAPVLDVFDRPQQQYTQDLLSARPLLTLSSKPTFGRENTACRLPNVGFDEKGRGVLLAVDGLDVRFAINTPTGSDTVHAVHDLTFKIRRGTTLGLVGESGSGKSTVAAALTGLVKPDGGQAVLDGTDLLAVPRSQRKAVRRRVALVFQDPYSALDARASVAAAIAEPLLVHRLCRDNTVRRGRIGQLLEMVGLRAEFASRYPHELSGGQRQRVCIARALAAEPELVILDEATASLDVSVQARVLDLISELQQELGLTFLFIGHDLAVIQQVSHDVLVMQAGEEVEYGPASDLFAAPQHDYTRALLAAVPPPQPRVRLGPR